MHRWHKIENIVSQWLYYISIMSSIFFEPHLEIAQMAWKKKGDSENSPLTYGILWVKSWGKTDSRGLPFCMSFFFRRLSLSDVRSSRSWNSVGAWIQDWLIHGGRTLHQSLDEIIWLWVLKTWLLITEEKGQPRCNLSSDYLLT